MASSLDYERARFDFFTVKRGLRGAELLQSIAILLYQAIDDCVASRLGSTGDPVGDAAETVQVIEIERIRSRPKLLKNCS